MGEFSDQDVFGSATPGDFTDTDVFGAPQKPSVAESAVAPITNIPSTYSEMVNESVGQMGRGVGQIESGSPWEIAKGVGNVALGGLGYVTAPINAPIHTIVGKPVADVTGSPVAGSLAEAGAGFALPIPKGIPRIGKAAEFPAESEFGVTLSKGEAANDLAMRQKEQAALRRGEVPAWPAQRAAQIESAQQGLSQSLDPFGQTLAETPQEAGALASQGIRSQAATSKAAVKAAYDEAKGMGGVLEADVFREMPEGIKTDLAGAAEPVIVDPNTTPNAAKMLNYIQGKVGPVKTPNLADPNAASQAPIVTADLATVDQWRKALSGMRRDAAANPGDARATRAVLDAFDDRIDQAVNSNRFTGDPAAVAAWNNARAAYSDYRSTYTGGRNDPVGRVVQKIIGDNVNDPMTPTKVIDQIVGSSGVSPSSLNIGVANRVKSILGEQSPEWIAVKQGVLQRLISSGEGEAALGTGQQAQRLSKFLNGDLASTLYSPTEQATLRNYANLMRRITMPQGSYFPSAPPIQQALAAMRARVGGIVGALIGHTLVPIPLVGELGGLAAGAQTERALERLHSGVSKQLPIVADQMAAWSRAQSAAMAQPANPLLRRGAVGATVNLQKALDPLGIDLKQLPGIQTPGTAGAQDDQQNVPGPVQKENGGQVVGQQRATGGKVGDSGHKGPLNRRKGQPARPLGARLARDGKLYVKKYGLAGVVGAGASHFQTVPVDHQPDFGDQPQERAAGGRVEAANIDAEPTEAQKKAGNYAKDHVHVHGLDITIENAKGHYRRGIGGDGKPWQVKMPAHYGYIKGTVGKDKDHVDVYLGPHLQSPTVWIVDQVNADSRKFDEHKAFVGFASKSQVVETYRKAFSDGRAHERLGHLTRMNIETFKRWLETGDMKKTADAHFPDAPRDNDKNKTTKKEAAYRGGNAKKRCGICSMYVPPSSCTAVRGVISSWAVCKFFERKK